MLREVEFDSQQVRSHFAKKDIEGSGRSHHGSNPPLPRQHEQHPSGLEPVFHTRTKRIEVHYHFIQECDVDQQHIGTNLQTTNIFTKSLGANKLRQFTMNLGLWIANQPRLRGSKE